MSSPQVRQRGATLVVALIFLMVLSLLGIWAVSGTTLEERMAGNTRNRDLAMQAGEDGADYVAFGAFFPSTTKEVTVQADPEILTWWSELMELPCCAIGGITAANCAPLVKAGANFLAVVGAVWGHPDGEAAGVKALNGAIAAALAAGPRT